MYIYIFIKSGITGAVLEPTILAEFVQTGVLLDWQKLELGVSMFYQMSSL